jgi:hypothetical protein
LTPINCDDRNLNDPMRFGRSSGSFYIDNCKQIN